MITGDQLLAHAIGDYVLQSDWMANTKTRSSVAALVHVLTYSLAFLFLTQSIPALALIAGTHFAIDRWRLARYVCWLKNWMSPTRPRPWRDCTGTGYDPDRPAWLSVWLLIIADNTLHVAINGIALAWVA